MKETFLVDVRIVLSRFGVRAACRRFGWERHLLAEDPTGWNLT